MNLGFGIEKLLNRKAEREEASNTIEDPRNLKGFRADANHPENKYNDDGDEGFLKPESTFVSIEEVSTGESEDDFINKLSDKLEKEMMSGENPDDKYDFIPLIVGLVKTAQVKGEKELNEVIGKASRFVGEYRKILRSGLSDERNENRGSEGKEYEACQKAFKEIFGSIAYFDGNMEALPRQKFVKLKEPKVNENGYVELGNKIYYDKRGIGFLSKEEAEKANQEAPKRNNYKKVGQKV